jgi:hypothetical protein
MTIILNEEINNIRGSYLLQNYSQKDFLSTWEGNVIEGKKEYNNIMKYLTNKVLYQSKNVNYNFSPNRTNGRLYGKYSIQNIPKDIRAFICNNTTDIDMINAHPTILNKLCEHHNFECPNLKQYIYERGDCLDKIQYDDNIDYGKAKMKVLTAINNGRTQSNCEFMNNFNKEMKTIRNKFLLLDDYKYIQDIVKKNGKYNFEGSFIANVLCVYENEILTKMREYCINNNIEIHSLMFDGMMVYNNPYVDENMLTEFENFIHQETIFNDIKLSIKPHETTLTMSENWIDNGLMTYEEVKENFEKTNCKVGCEFIKESDNEFLFFKKSDFIILHEELRYFDEIKSCKEKFIFKWIDDENKRMYEKFDTYPKENLCPDNVFNLWSKFKVEKMDNLEKDEYLEKGLQFFLNHILILSGNDNVMFEFIKLWISQMFQYPENKSTELIFISNEGAGKGEFLEFFKTIMGGDNRCWECDDPEKDVFGSFNDDMKDAFLVCFNESNKSKFYNNNDKKKNLITGSYININPKFGKKFKMRSYHRFITFSNNADPCVKNKRRDTFIRCSDEKIGDEAYHQKGWEFAKDINVCKYIHQYFMNLPTKRNIVQVDMPMSEYDRIIAEEFKNPIIRFLKEYMMELTDDVSREDEVLFIRSLHIYEEYVKYRNLEKLGSYGRKPAGFSMELAKLNIKGIGSPQTKYMKEDKKEARCYIINPYVAIEELKNK